MTETDVPGRFKKKMPIGIKLVCGVALASNLCILLLIYAVWHWDRKVNVQADNLVSIQKNLNKNLRISVSQLQARLVKLPALFELGAGTRVFNWLHDAHSVANESVIKGRDQIIRLYNRSERRDLARGKFVIQHASRSITVSKGILDKEGKFRDQVNRFSLLSDTPETEIPAIKARIRHLMAQGQTLDSIKQTLSAIKAEIAEELILAENNRIEVLNRIDHIEAVQHTLADAKQKRQIIIIGISILTILANIIMIIVLTRSMVTNPIKNVVTGLKDISQGQGDLTRTLVPGSRDELGELAYFFNVFIHKLHRIISRVKDQMESLSRSIREISRVSTDLGRKAESMNQKSETAAKAIRETTRNIEHMAVSAGNVSQRVADVTRSSGKVSEAMGHIGEEAADVFDSVSMVAAAIEEMYTSLNEVARNSGRGVDVARTATYRAKESTRMIRNLGTSAKEINEIVTLITGIAEQTHLLALNAAIEAASAGAAGKGFTVVANEVKDLSRRTADATRIITEKAVSMQTSTDVVISSIRAIMEVISETHNITTAIAASVEEQTATMTEISKNISETALFAESVSTTLKEKIQLEKKVSDTLKKVSDDARAIAGDAEKAALTTARTLENVLDVNHAALANFEGSKKIEAQVRKLTRLYRQLQQVVAQFKVKGRKDESRQALAN